MDTPEQPTLIIIKDTAAQERAAVDYPLLSIADILDGKADIETIVFQPQGFRVVLQRPPEIDTQALMSKYSEMLDKNKAKALVYEKKLDGKTFDEIKGDLSEEEIQEYIQFSTEAIPYSLETVLLCWKEPEGMTMDTLKRLIIDLEGVQVTDLFKRAGRLTQTLSPGMVAKVKN